MLKKRHIELLQQLLATEKPVTGESLAQRLRISSRTLRHDIKKMNDYLQRHGAHIKSIMGQGYLLHVRQRHHFQALLNMLASVKKTDVTFSMLPKERVIYLIRRFLFADTFLKLDDLAAELFVSLSTIQNDVREVRRRLGDYELILEARPNYGVIVHGSELHLRFCMAQYGIDRGEGETALGLIQLPERENELYKPIFDVILNYVTAYGVSMSDIAINNLFIHLVIAYKRVKEGQYITLYQADVCDIVEQKEYAIAQKLVRKIEKVMAVSFPSIETAYVAIHLLGTNMTRSIDIGDDEQVREDIQIVELILTQSLQEISETLHIDLRHDEELMMGLRLHLKPAMNRSKFGMNVRNPLLEDIKKNYPLAFEAGIIVGVTTGKLTGFHFPENEIGYIALHLGAAMKRMQINNEPKRCLVVCASGLGTAQLIYYKLRAEFGADLDVVGTTERYKLADYPLTAIDFIVSSVPITIACSIPVIEVNAILSKQDIDQIRSFVYEGQTDVGGYFTAEWTYLQQNYSSRNDVLAFLDGELLKKGMISESIIPSIVAREKVATTAFGNLVAIPHPLTSKATKTTIVICTLQTPIDWDGHDVQFICLLNIKREAKENLQQIYHILGQMIEDNTVINRILKVNSYEQLMSEIQRLSLVKQE